MQATSRASPKRTPFPHSKRSRPSSTRLQTASRWTTRFTGTRLGKWSVRQVVGHLIDTERVMGYRAFAIGRGEAKPLPGFDENAYVAQANSDERSVKELAHEFAAVRHANLWVIRHWSPEDWDRTGNANGKPVSARAITYIMAGHVRHHMALLRERYGLEV